jgi:hypothetical protein
MIDLSSSSD